MALPKASAVRARVEQEHTETLEAVRRLAARLNAEVGVARVILFGSRARDDWHGASDADVFVVSDAFEGAGLEDRYNAVADRWDGPVSIAPFVLTEAEWQAARGKGGLVDMALRDGVLEVPADG